MSPLFDHYGDPNMEPGDEFEPGTYGLCPVMLEPETRNDDGDGVTQAYGFDIEGNNQMRARFGMPLIPDFRSQFKTLPVLRLPDAGPTWDTPKRRA